MACGKGVSSELCGEEAEVGGLTCEKLTPMFSSLFLSAYKTVTDEDEEEANRDIFKVKAALLSEENWPKLLFAAREEGKQLPDPVLSELSLIT